MNGTLLGILRVAAFLDGSYGMSATVEMEIMKMERDFGSLPV